MLRDIHVHVLDCMDTDPLRRGIRATRQGSRTFGAPNSLGFNTRYSVISVKLIIKKQEQILRSFIEVVENLKFETRTSC